MGQNYLAVLTGHHVNEVFFFYKKMFGRFVSRPKNSGRNNTGGRKAVFQVATHDSILQPNVMVKTAPPPLPQGSLFGVRVKKIARREKGKGESL